jgi:SAM-dependent methyltransferase
VVHIEWRATDLPLRRAGREQLSSVGREGPHPAKPTWRKAIGDQRWSDPRLASLRRRCAALVAPPGDRGVDGYKRGAFGKTSSRTPPTLPCDSVCRSTPYRATEERMSNWVVESEPSGPLSATAGDERTAMRLRWPEEATDRLSHQLFRFPAKFHPPVVRQLLSDFSSEGDLVVDPFCGSGTAMVEAACLGRNGIGMDIDPLAVFLTRAKTRCVSGRALGSATDALRSALQLHRRPDADYERFKFEDITIEGMMAAVRDENLPVPALPRMAHWFRRYVAVDLGRILATIRMVDCSEEVRRVLLLAFAAIIRNSSNADPVPVSGLEVTAHMRRRDAAGRVVNPYALFDRALTNTVVGMTALAEACVLPVAVKAWRRDARSMVGVKAGSVDLILTSPPYFSAVDYYRRHLLEMFWLGLTTSEEDRLALLPNYIGRKSVRRDAVGVSSEPPGPITRRLVDAIANDSPEGARSFRHYLAAMARSMRSMARCVKPGGTVVLVVGANRWRGQELPVVDTFRECAGNRLRLEEVHWYPLKNRYMSYVRKNEANISQEYVLVFKPTMGMG